MLLTIIIIVIVCIVLRRRDKSTSTQMLDVRQPQPIAGAALYDDSALRNAKQTDYTGMLLMREYDESRNRVILVIGMPEKPTSGYTPMPLQSHPTSTGQTYAC